MEEDDDNITQQEKDALTEAIKELRIKRKVASNKPEEGIWYYIWMKPNWKLVDLQGGDNMHGELWQDLVHHRIKDHYKLTLEQVDVLEDASQGVPRGRVVLERDKYVFYHGGDFPTGKSTDAEKKKLIGLFNLTCFYLEDKNRVEFRFAEHYKMDPDEQEIVKSVLGEVSY